MREFHPILLSRDLGEVQARYERFLGALESGRTAKWGDPFRGALFPGKTGLDEVLGLHDEEPLKTPLTEWIYFLVDARVNLPARLEEIRLYREERAPVGELGDRLFSLVELSRGVQSLDERSAAFHFDARRRLSRSLGAHRVLLLERENEVVERLGFPRTTPVLSPSRESARIVELARKFLEVTRDGEWSVRGGFAFRRGLLGFGAEEGWPARIAEDTLRALVGFPRIFAGLSLSGIALPERRVPASFWLALYRIGCSWASALAPRQLPFVIARAPGGLRERTRGHFFAALVLLRPFLRSRLGLSGGGEDAARRAISRAMLLELRLAAARVICLAAAREGRGRLSEASMEMSLGLFGDEWSFEEWMGTFGVPSSSEFDFAARLLAFSELDGFVEAFDEDFFASERAGERLRDEQSEPRARLVSHEELENGLKSATTRLVAAIQGG